MSGFDLSKTFPKFRMRIPHLMSESAIPPSNEGWHTTLGALESLCVDFEADRSKKIFTLTLLKEFVERM